MQQPEGIHPGIVGPINRCLRFRDDHKLVMSGAGVDRQSLQFLVNFLSQDTQHQVTELDFYGFTLLQPPDGGVNVLCDLFANITTTFTKITLRHCDFGATRETSQVLAAVQSNRSVTDLTFFGIQNLQGAALGNCISGVLQNATHLQRLELGDRLDATVLLAMQSGLRINQHLKILDLCSCGITDEGLHLLADALVGNNHGSFLYHSESYHIHWSC
jgi:Leucine Rich repeat